MAKKEKKEKVVYYDDGRTIADMSNVGRGRPSFSSRGTTSKFRDIWRTYWDATRMMLLPTLAVGAGIGVIYGIIYLLFYLAA